MARSNAHAVGASVRSTHEHRRRRRRIALSRSRSISLYSARFRPQIARPLERAETMVIALDKRASHVHERGVGCRRHAPARCQALSSWRQRACVARGARRLHSPSMSRAIGCGTRGPRARAHVSSRAGAMPHARMSHDGRQLDGPEKGGRAGPLHEPRAWRKRDCRAE